MWRSPRAGACLLVTLVGAALAATAAPAGAGTVAPAAAEPADTVQVRFAVTKFVVRGKHLLATGQTIATFQTTQGAYSTAKPFSAKVVRVRAAGSSVRTPQAATRICDLLNLNLAPTHLELLGLIVDLSRVVLTIRANTEGGILGALLCGLGGPVATTQTAAQLTQLTQTSGLGVGPGFTLPLQLGSPDVQRAAVICRLLDLTLGPLDLSLLGLVVHLDALRLTITADSTRGLLGSLLCSLGGVPTLP
jgi:hypothetical protein